jgi:quercetin dioxygenase-like cupin family protein
MARPVVSRRGETKQQDTPYGDSIAFLAGERETEHTFSVHERVAPPGSRSVPHVHHHFMESFYIIDGALSVTVDDELIEALPGTFIGVPKGAVHGWKNESQNNARVLIIFTPSQERAYFDELDALTKSPDGESAAQAMLALMKKYRQD